MTAEFQFDVQILIADCRLSENAVSTMILHQFDVDSLIVGGDHELMKLHVHSNAPWEILQYCHELGEIFDIVIENMARQAAGLPG